MLSEYVVYL